MLRAAVRYEVEYWGGSFFDDNYDYIEKAAQWLTDPKTPGLYIAGTVGNGKTTLLNAIVDTINVNTKLLGRDERGKEKWVRMFDAPELVNIVRKDDEGFDQLCKWPMLAIDDLGSEQTSVKTYGNIVNPAVELLAYRYKRRMFTIVTTNLKPEEIRANYGDRIADRLNEMMTRIVIKVPTYRTKNGRKQ